MRKVLLFLSLTLILLSSCTSIKEQEDNVLNIYSQEVVSGLDPMFISDRFSNNVARQIYEGLYEYHYLKYPYTLEPVLADGMPVVKDNDLTYTIKIKHGVYFADDPCFKSTRGEGRVVTAHDFIYSLKRFFASPHTEHLFFSIIFSEIIIGVAEFRAASQKEGFNFNREKISGIKVLDNYTLQFKLKKTSTYFPAILADPNGFVVAKEAVDYYGTDFKYHPVGTGPFKLKLWERGSKLVFIRNPNYKHGFYPLEAKSEDAGMPLPFLEKVVVYILAEEQIRWLNFVRGKIDIVVPDKDSYYDAFPIRGRLSKHLVDMGIRVKKKPKLEVKYYAFNMTDKITGKNKYLRQAISLAYDGSKHSALFFNNQAFFSNWIIPPKIFGFDASYKNPYRQYNLAKAKELIEKAGYPDGQGLPPLKMLILDSISARQLGEFFAKSVSAIGVKINLEAKNFELLLKEVNEERRFHLARFQRRAEFPFAEDFLRILYGKASPPGPNHSLFNNSEYNQLYEKVTKMKKVPAKLKLLNRMRDIAVEECALIPLVNPVIISLEHAYVENYKPHPLVGKKFKYIKINIEKRKEIQKKFLLEQN